MFLNCINLIVFSSGWMVNAVYIDELLPSLIKGDPQKAFRIGINERAKRSVTAPSPSAVPHLVVHHHHFHYCCPGLAGRSPGAHAHPPHSPSPSTPSCGCDVTGICSCVATVPVVTQDSVNKRFYDFIAKNFIRKEPMDKTLECSKTLMLDDPVCQEFLTLFSQRPDVQSASSMSPPTQIPPTTSPNPSRKPKASFQEFQDIKTMFDALKSEIQDTLANTDRMANKMGHLKGF